MLYLCAAPHLWNKWNLMGTSPSSPQELQLPDPSLLEKTQSSPPTMGSEHSLYLSKDF